MVLFNRLLGTTMLPIVGIPRKIQGFPQHERQLYSMNVMNWSFPPSHPPTHPPKKRPIDWSTVPCLEVLGGSAKLFQTKLKQSRPQNHKLICKKYDTILNKNVKISSDNNITR